MKTNEHEDEGLNFERDAKRQICAKDTNYVCSRAFDMLTVFWFLFWAIQLCNEKDL